jgi:hypothetical protein
MSKTSRPLCAEISRMLWNLCKSQTIRWPSVEQLNSSESLRHSWATSMWCPASVASGSNYVVSAPADLALLGPHWPAHPRVEIRRTLSPAHFQTLMVRSALALKSILP